MKRLGILHLSDIHISASSISVINGLVNKLIKDIQKVKSEYDMSIDLICFAGDLIERGDKAYEDEKQIELAEKYFVDPLLQQLGLSKDRFILVPGNHEVDRREIAKITEKGLANMSSLEDINDAIYHMEDEYKRRLKYFYDYMYTNYVQDANQWNLGYSVERIINGVTVGIVGLDSSWRSTGAGYTERGHMLVGEQQVGVLFDNIKDTDLKICLMHHPIDWLSDLEMNSVAKKLNHFDLVLRGHVHDLDDKQICTQRYKTVYNTSGKIYPLDNYYSGYSLIDLDMDLQKCRIYAREYLTAPREDFDKALRINEDGKTEYLLTSFDEEKVIECDLKLQLKEYFERATEKYVMLKNIDSFSPDKIADFFVEPIIYEKSEYERSEIVKKGEKSDNPVPLEDIIQIEDNIMLIGKRESGKTTILQKFGISHTTPESKQIPIYIDMLNMTKGRDRVLNACYNFLFDVLSEEISLSKKQATNLLNNGKLICLIDNVNISNADHIYWIQSFTKAFPKNRFVFAVEEKFYQTYNIKELPDLRVPFKPVYLDYFGKKQVREMVTKWGYGKEGFDANEMTTKIVTYCNNIHFSMTPFNIAVFMTIWDVDRNFVPINEGKVMRTYLETVLDKLSTEGFQRSEYDFDVKQHFLGYLAWKMYLKDEYYFKIDEFEKIVNEYHDQFGFKKSESKFDKIFFEKNILYISGENVFFSNTSILEYCLAYYATVEPELYKQMTQKGNRGSFVHELSFYSGIIKDCTDLLDSLNLEITETILDNMDVLDEIEGIKIKIELQSDKESFKKAITQNRKTMTEIDDMTEVAVTRNEKTPMEITKLNTIDESESFMELLAIYGNVIKNAETASKKQKKLHLDTYILGMNFQFGLMIKDFSAYLNSKTKEDLPDEIREKHPALTDEEYNEIRESILDLLKIALPIGMQFFIAENVGTPKLDIVINELIKENEDKKFTKFMLSFLYCDISNGRIKNFLQEYIKNEESKDILKLVLFKLGFYYSMRYFGNNAQVDNAILDLITDVQIKLSGKNQLGAKMRKGEIKKQIRQQFETQRRQIAL